MENPRENPSLGSTTWAETFGEVGCGGLLLLAIVWFIGTMITNDPMWFAK